jgi:mannose-6-phosphate isomerase-like protein (cupin superfamily)
MDQRNLQPQVTTLAEAESLSPFGIDMKVLLGAEATGGTLSVLIAEIKPGEGPPRHVHRDREEFFFVIEGTYRLSIDGRETVAGPGAVAFVPRGTVHAFTNIGETTGKMLEWTVPGTNEPYFKAVHAMEREVGFDPARFAEINRHFETEFAE